MGATFCHGKNMGFEVRSSVCEARLSWPRTVSPGAGKTEGHPTLPASEPWPKYQMTAHPQRSRENVAKGFINTLQGEVACSGSPCSRTSVVQFPSHDAAFLTFCQFSR